MSYPKIFCDIADISVIKKFNKKSIVKGFTTNPSLMRKAGAKNYQNYSKQILRTCKKKTHFLWGSCRQFFRDGKTGFKDKFLG